MWVEKEQIHIHAPQSSLYIVLCIQCGPKSLFIPHTGILSYRDRLNELCKDVATS